MHIEATPSIHRHDGSKIFTERTEGLGGEEEG